MRVLALCTWSPFPPDNGSRIRTHHLIRALGDAHDVEAITFCSREGASGWPKAIPALERVRLTTVDDDPFRLVHAPQWVKYLSPVPLCYWPSARMQRSVRALPRSGTYDAVVALNVPTALYALHFRRAVRVLDVDTSLGYQMRERYLESGRSSLRSHLSWWKAELSEGWLMRRFDVCTLTNEIEAPYLRSVVGRIPCQVKVVRNGVDCEHHRPADTVHQPGQLIYTGALTYQANYDAVSYFLADIYPRIRREETAVSLAITGSHTGVDLTELSLDPSVRLTGYVDDIRPWVQASQACIVPLREGGGTRIKILEAMALGTPVVTTSKGMEGLDVIPGEHLLVADDPAEFAQQTVSLLRDHALGRALAARARRRVEERYDWRAIGREFVEMVEDAATRRTHEGRHG
jgi:polysaccharide biosynthesis protein PslH